MTGIEFALVLLAWAVGGGSPGPATMAIAGTSMNRGRGLGLAVAAGIVSGSAAWGLAAGLGLSALLPLYIKGLLIHLTNPKAILGWGAVFAIAVPVGAAQTVVLETYAALLAVSCCVFFGYALVLSSGVFVRGYQRMRRWFEGAFALLFGLAGIKILTARLT